ncbi:MAG: hypothetical protein ACC645_11470 [Pirellulales bacterium]
MATKRQRPPRDPIGQAKLLERIGDRYAQLEEKLDELEAKLSSTDANEPDEASTPRKPR